MSRKTCPYCRQKWPDGKDPADGGGLYGLRLADLCRGLDYNSGSCLAEIFQQPIAGELCLTNLEVIASRYFDLQAARAVLDSALADLAVCPAANSIPAFVRAHATGRKEDGLTTYPELVTGRYRVIATNDGVAFEEIRDGE